MLKGLIESRQFLLKACAKKYMYFLWERKKKERQNLLSTQLILWGENPNSIRASVLKHLYYTCTGWLQERDVKTSPKTCQPPPQGNQDGCWDPRALLISFCIRSVFCPLCLALPLFLAKNGFKSPWKNLLLLLLHVAPGLFKDGATGVSFGWESWHPL